jgi:hypothetical protein
MFQHILRREAIIEKEGGRRVGGHGVPLVQIIPLFFVYPGVILCYCHPGWRDGTMGADVWDGTWCRARR